MKTVDSGTKGHFFGGDVEVKLQHVQVCEYIIHKRHTYRNAGKPPPHTNVPKSNNRVRIMKRRVPREETVGPVVFENEDLATLCLFCHLVPKAIRDPEFLVPSNPNPLYPYIRIHEPCHDNGPGTG